MKPDKQRLQYIILAVLALGLVGYIVYSIFFAGKPATPPAKKTDAASASSNADNLSLTEDDRKSGVSAGEVPNAVFPGLAIPTPRRDPFSIQSSPISPTKTTVPTTSKVPKLPAISTNLLKPFNPFKRIGELPGATGVKSITIIPPALPELSGVLMGPNNVAIIKYGGKTYIVSEGSSFAGRYRLLRVTKNSVVLQIRSTQIRIGLGGTK